MTAAGGDPSALGVAVFGASLFICSAAAIIVAEARGLGLISWLRRRWFK